MRVKLFLGDGAHIQQLLKFQQFIGDTGWFGRRCSLRLCLGLGCTDHLQQGQAFLGLLRHGFIDHPIFLDFRADKSDIFRWFGDIIHGYFDLQLRAGGFSVLFSGHTSDHGTDAAKQQAAGNRSAKTAFCEGITVFQQFIVHNIRIMENAGMLFPAGADRRVPEFLVIIETKEAGNLLCDVELCEKIPVASTALNGSPHIGSSHSADLR